MPTYQYACNGCDERFEQVQAFTDPTLTVHEPGCGAPVRKLFGSVGVVFKGTGFYRNDSRGGPSSGEGTDTKSTPESSSDSGTATDPKPAEKKTATGPAEGSPTKGPATTSESKPAPAKTTAA